MKSIWNNVKLLYFVFIITLINLGWFLYKQNKESLIIFLTFSLVIYLVNKNMIFVLGIPIIIADIFTLFKKEGFEDVEKEALSALSLTDVLDSDPEHKSDNDHNEHNDSEDYLHDKTIIEKLKKINPVLLETLHKMNSVDIQELNKTINNLTKSIDP